MRYFILGDSQAAGAPGEALQARLRARGHEVLRVAESGKGAVWWAFNAPGRVQEAIGGFHPDRVILLFGSNDEPSERLRQAFHQLERLADGAKVFYSGPPAYPAATNRRELGERIRVFARSAFGDRYLDAWPATDARRFFLQDGTNVHMTRAGGEVWASAIVEQLPTELAWLWGLALVGAAGVGSYYLARRLSR